MLTFAARLVWKSHRIPDERDDLRVLLGRPTARQGMGETCTCSAHPLPFSGDDVEESIVVNHFSQHVCTTITSRIFG